MNRGWFDAPLTITPDKPVRLRYGLWIHPAVPDARKLDRRWQAFASGKLASMTATSRKE